ncbi:MAG: hypothetical protein LBK83_14275 [Treponema sp.]|jgi:hypothetical protein|nr:hypothetical protein [Treponema sp.]
MTKTTIRESSEPFCLWCDRTKPATKAGWIEHHLTHFTVYFCSKNCLTSATLDGKGIILDAGKLGLHHKQKKRAAAKALFKEILEKDRMDPKDMPAFLLAMSAKQKQVLACVGLASLMGRCYRNPKKILAEIDRLKE